VGVMFVVRWIVCAGQWYGSKKRGTVHRVGRMMKLVSFHCLGWDVVLEGIGYPKGGIGTCVVKYHMCHHGELWLC